MKRTIKINNSEITICKYYDNGYCRYKENCKYFHSAKNCEVINCENQTCKNRHPKQCRYYRRQNCKFGEDCCFKHDKNGNDFTEKVCSEENNKLKNKLKVLEKALENMKKEIELKDFFLNEKENIIEQKNVSIQGLGKKVKDLDLVASHLKSEIRKKG